MHTQTHADTHQLTHTHRAKAHDHTNKQTHSITLIRLLSPLHLYQTKQAAADDGVSTTGIAFSGYLLSKNDHETGRMPGPV